MNEQFDADLSRALKHGTGRELQGWEFTPAMRKNVLARIRAEESGTAAPAESRRPIAIPRPLIWATLAAAAFMIALNVDISGFGGASKKEAVSDFAPRAQTASPSPASAPAQEPKPAEPEKVTANASVESAAPVPEPRAALKSGGAGQAETARSQSVAISLEAPAAPKAAGAADAATFMAPPGVAAAKIAMVANFSVTPAGTRVLMLNSTGLTALNHDGIADWQAELPGASFESAVAVAGDGHLAVNADTSVYLLSSGGKLEGALKFASPATRVAWASDGRLGVLHAAVEVFRDGKLQFKVPAAAGSQLAFGPEGTLAVLEPVGNLFVYDREGRAVAAQTGINPTFLAYGPDEDTIITAAGAYSRKLGEPRWRMPFEPLGLTLAGETVIAWNADQVVGLRTNDGAELWRATRHGAGPGLIKVVASPERIVAVAALENGGALWAFHPTEGLKHTEFLAAIPLDLTVIGNRVTLMMPAGTESREIP